MLSATVQLFNVNEHKDHPLVASRYYRFTGASRVNQSPIGYQVVLVTSKRPSFSVETDAVSDLPPKERKHLKQTTKGRRQSPSLVASPSR